jgi:carbon monoxide dehydrogenase subunit G
MSKVRVEEEIAADSAAVWDLMSDFGALRDWNPQIETCEVDGDGVGAVRTFSMGGITIKERLESLDPAARTYSYSIIAGPIPVTGYLANVAVSDAGAGKTKIVWTSDFEANGAPEADMAQLFQGIYQGGIKAVEKKVNEA